MIDMDIDCKKINEEFILTVVVDKDTKEAKISTEAIIDSEHKVYYDLRNRIHNLCDYVKDNQLDDKLKATFSRLTTIASNEDWDKERVNFVKDEPLYSYLEKEVLDIEEYILNSQAIPRINEVFIYSSRLSGTYTHYYPFFTFNPYWGDMNKKRFSESQLPKLNEEYSKYKEEILEIGATDFIFQDPWNAKKACVKKIEDLDMCYKNNVWKRYIEETDFLKNQSNHFVKMLEYETSIWKIKASLLGNSEIKAYSNMEIGWSSYSFELGNGYNATINTNFGYGNSSYFYLVVSFKGIRITPYSKYVQYRQTNYNEFHRYTLDAFLENTEWSRLFEYVVDSYNTALRSTSEFINKYFISELSIMVSDLERLFHNSFSNYSGYLKKKQLIEVGDKVYIVENANIYIINKSVLESNCSSSDLSYIETEVYDKTKQKTLYIPRYSFDYEYYPFEKIVGALEFLDSINKIEEVADVAPYIDRILNLNKAISQPVYSLLVYLENTLKVASSATESLSKELVDINNKISSFNIFRDEVLEEIKNEKYAVRELIDTYFFYYPESKIDENTIKIYSSTEAIKGSIKEMDVRYFAFYAETWVRKTRPDLEIINLRKEKSKLEGQISNYKYIKEKLNTYINRFKSGIAKIDSFMS